MYIQTVYDSLYNIIITVNEIKINQVLIIKYIKIHKV